MSYETMDHAGWVQANIGPARRMKKPGRNVMGQVVGWHAAPDELNRFQARAMDILGIVFGGIYNAPILWDRVEWMPGSLHVPIRPGRTMATWDYGGLSGLVFLCHAARIRASIAVDGRGWMLSFHQRSHDGGMSERHPDLAEAVATFDSYLPADHRIRYVAEHDDPLPARRRAWLEYAAGSNGGRWADDAAAAAARGDRREAKSRLELCARDAETARSHAQKLGGGPELAALVARVEAHHARAKAAFDAMPVPEDVA